MFIKCMDTNLYVYIVRCIYPLLLILVVAAVREKIKENENREKYERLFKTMSMIN